jgi:hypothetical protein
MLSWRESRVLFIVEDTPPPACLPSRCCCALDSRKPFAVLRRLSILWVEFVSSHHLSVDGLVSLNMDVEALLDQLTVEEKVSLTAGKSLRR